MSSRGRGWWPMTDLPTPNDDELAEQRAEEIAEDLEEYEDHLRDLVNEIGRVISRTRYPKDDQPEGLDWIIDETHRLVARAIGYIRRQEDGPMTMRHALEEINEAVAAIRWEGNHLTAKVKELEVLVAEASTQRDDALQQRDFLLKVLKLFGITLRDE